MLEAYEHQQREAYINRTIPVIDELSDIAYRLADAYEREYRANPTYENEERMRYWRYVGAKHWYSKSDGLYYTPTREYKNRKKEYEELIQRHTEAIARANDVEQNILTNFLPSGESPTVIPTIPENHNKKNTLTFAGLLGLTIGINVLVHILFTLAS